MIYNHLILLNRSLYFYNSCFFQEARLIVLSFTSRMLVAFVKLKCAHEDQLERMKCFWLNHSAPVLV